MISPFYGFTGYELWMVMMIWYFDIFDMAVEVGLKHSQAIFRIISVYWEGRKDVFQVCTGEKHGIPAFLLLICDQMPLQSGVMQSCRCWEPGRKFSYFVLHSSSLLGGITGYRGLSAAERPKRGSDSASSCWRDDPEGPRSATEPGWFVLRNPRFNWDK